MDLWGTGLPASESCISKGSMSLLPFIITTVYERLLCAKHFKSLALHSPYSNPVQHALATLEIH